MRTSPTFRAAIGLLTIAVTGLITFAPPVAASERPHAMKEAATGSTTYHFATVNGQIWLDAGHFVLDKNAATVASAIKSHF